MVVVQSLSCVPSLWLNGLQHDRLPCPSTTGACSNSCPLSCQLSNNLFSSLLLLPIISSRNRVFSNESVLPIRWSRFWSFSSASVLPVNIQGWFPLGLACLIPLLSKGVSRVFSNTTFQKHPFFSTLRVHHVKCQTLWITSWNQDCNSLWYAGNIILIIQSKEELKSLLMKVKEESEKPGLNLNIQKRSIIATAPINSWQKVKTVTNFIFLGSKITADGD